MRSKLLAVLSLLIVASMVLAACQTPTPEIKEIVKTVIVENKTVETVVVEKEGQTTVITATPEPVAPVAKEALLRVNLGTYPDIIDPQKSSFVNEIGHLKLMYEGLTRLNDKLESIPAAAEKWEYNADATELTFTLRKDLKYSDGTILNAKRYEYSILRNIDPTTAGEYGSITDEIIGASEWRGSSPDDAAAADLKAAVEVRALDAAGAPCADYEQADCLTLALKFRQSAPYFHTVMSLWVTFPAKEENITEGGDNWWNSSKFHTGNGPFVLDSLEPFVRGYFVPNANYWRGQATYNIEFRYINDAAVSFEAYKNNEFDIVGAGAEDIATIKADAVLSKELMQYAGGCTYAVYFTPTKPPFDDIKVREAFSMALDRAGWVNDVLKGNGSVAHTWIVPGCPGYVEDDNKYSFNADAAKAALAESKYAGAMPEITATFSDTPRNRTRFEWLVSKWRDVLGIEVKLNPVEPTTYTALTKDKETIPQMFILGWCMDYPDPQNWLSVYWMSTSAYAARYSFSNPEMDEWMKKGDTESDPVKRMEYYKNAQLVLTDQAAVAYMWNNLNSYMVKPWVKGLVTTPQDSDFAGSNDPLTISIDTTMIP